MSSSSDNRGVFRRILDGVDTTRRVIVNLIFVLLVLIVLTVVFSGGGESVPEGSVLVLNLEGDLVEELTPVQPLASVFGGSTIAEVRLRDAVDVIDTAAKDSRIKMLLLKLEDLGAADTAKLAMIGDAITRFKASKKPVIAAGDSFTQEQYFLASYADQIYLNPMGQVLFTGYGFESIFFKQALDKLGVSVHVFRVGQFKAAVEPFIRDDMSEEARIANRGVIDSLWKRFTERVAANRNIEPTKVDAYLQTIDTLVNQAAGDLARVALESGLVDELLTRTEIHKRVKDQIGVDTDSDDIPQASYRQYLNELLATRFELATKPQVAVITVRGNIVVDDESGGAAGANQIAELIRTAREDDNVKAIVLRVDSPGGSAFASEVIRNELEVTQQAAKPVVSSMSGVAASGGYWISATANEIWADPATITGSIGIFGIAPSFEKSLDQIGVHGDGVTNSKFRDGMNITRGINETVASVLQSNVENGYRQFTQLVARGRELPLERVQAIAEGRIWSGADAKGIGLVDGLGDLTAAIQAAARLAKLKEGEYEVHYTDRGLSPQQALLRELVDQFGLGKGSLSSYGDLGRFAARLRAEITGLSQLDDPLRVYALCACNPSLP